MTSKIAVTEEPAEPGADYAVFEAEVDHVVIDQTVDEGDFTWGSFDSCVGRRTTSLSTQLGEYTVTVMPGTITLAAIAIFEERRDRQKGNAQHAARWPDLSAKRQANYRAEAKAALTAAGAL